MQDFVNKYGKVDGAYWWAVRKYEQSGKGSIPDRINSVVTATKVILKDAKGETLATYSISKTKKAGKSEKSSKRTSTSSSEPDIAEQE